MCCWLIFTHKSSSRCNLMDLFRRPDRIAGTCNAVSWRAEPSECLMFLTIGPRRCVNEEWLAGLSWIVSLVVEPPSTYGCYVLQGSSTRARRIHCVSRHPALESLGENGWSWGGDRVKSNLSLLGEGRRRQGRIKIASAEWCEYSPYLLLLLNFFLLTRCLCPTPVTYLYT
jgi:hypothetical protein